MTAKYKNMWLVFGALSALANIFPVAWFFFQALADSTLVYQKVSLSMTVLIVLILTIYNFVKQQTMRCRVWIIVCGIYIAISNFMAAIIIITVSQVLDELVFRPIARYYKEKFRINKEIDKRNEQPG